MRFLHTFISHATGNAKFLPGEAPQGPPGGLFRLTPNWKNIPLQIMKILWQKVVSSQWGSNSRPHVSQTSVVSNRPLWLIIGYCNLLWINISQIHLGKITFVFINVRSNELSIINLYSFSSYGLFSPCSICTHPVLYRDAARFSNLGGQA